MGTLQYDLDIPHSSMVWPWWLTLAFLWGSTWLSPLLLLSMANDFSSSRCYLTLQNDLDLSPYSMTLMTHLGFSLRIHVTVSASALEQSEWLFQFWVFSDLTVWPWSLTLQYDLDDSPWLLFEDPRDCLRFCSGAGRMTFPALGVLSLASGNSSQTPLWRTGGRSKQRVNKL